MVLKDIGEYKDKFLSAILKSEDIGKLILEGNYNAETVVDDLPYKNIFPFLYVEDTQTEVKSYICFEVEIPTVPTSTIKDMTIVVCVYCHKDLMRYSKKGYSGTRMDILADMIERLMSSEENCRNFGIGKLNLKSVKPLTSINKNYYGKQMIYQCSDFR